MSSTSSRSSDPTRSTSRYSTSPTPPSPSAASCWSSPPCWGSTSTAPGPSPERRRVPDVRQLPVPDGLAGMRLDAGLARVLVDGAPAARSSKMTVDSWLEITLPEPDRPAAVVPQTVEGLTVLYRDADI